MEYKDQLTNEKIRKKFTSQFELVNYAIRLAENMILTGRDSRVKIDSQNRSLLVLTEILQGKDSFDEIVINENVYDEGYHKVSEKNSERKKTGRF